MVAPCVRDLVLRRLHELQQLVVVPCEFLSLHADSAEERLVEPEHIYDDVPEHREILAISCVLARDLSSSKSMSSVQCIASTPQCARIASSACLSSVAANYAEASEAESPADFVHKLKLAQKELKESRVWLLFASRLSPGEVVESLWSESRELLLMIGKSINTALARTKDNTIGA